MPYKLPPLLSLEYIRPVGTSVAGLALLLACILGVGAAVSWLLPGFHMPVWANIALFAGLVVLDHAKTARKAWSATPGELQFEAAQKLTRDRVSSIFFLALAALLAVLAIDIYPE